MGNLSEYQQMRNQIFKQYLLGELELDANCTLRHECLVREEYNTYSLQEQYDIHKNTYVVSKEYKELYSYPQEQLICMIQERDAQIHLLQNTLLPAPLRVAAHAIRLAVHARGFQQDGYKPIVQEQIAASLGVEIRQMQRYLHSLQYMGLLKKHPHPPQWPNTHNNSTWIMLSAALDSGIITAEDIQEKQPTRKAVKEGETHGQA